MTTYPFAQLDVFATGPLTGNPLAVVHDATGLADEQMQRFAQWTDLSETVFLLPPTREGAHYRTRIFTPDRELPFAGHPTLGSAYAWLTAHPEHTADAVVQDCGAGAVTVRRTASGLAFAAPPLLRSGPVDDAERAALAEGLRIDPGAIRAAEWVSNGPGWRAVLLEDADAVLAVQPGLVPGDVGIIGPYPAGSEFAFEVRAFFVKNGATCEDPVTGSFNAGVAQWLYASGRVSGPYAARQGTALGRAGRVDVERDAAGTVWVGGAVRTHIRGEVEI
ncbi:phenazine biosynthesis protein PhzF family [Pseudonocardia thermophila]|uniref:Phenazine biosynthesis protein PhzF family n=1 Tax=Pseudonocardia thermophila TaxID=1848 RepID=A0A1M6N4V7_PSETH|nr:PhzF family phenazine biosynthesis protein [Pseudonocardia thermophila]SHJ90759.1 phenazine biosynthesis protein PhzF family [Pseudonocardia thermophila]